MLLHDGFPSSALPNLILHFHTDSQVKLAFTSCNTALKQAISSVRRLWQPYADTGVDTRNYLQHSRSLVSSLSATCWLRKPVGVTRRSCWPQSSRKDEADLRWGSCTERSIQVLVLFSRKIWRANLNFGSRSVCHPLSTLRGTTKGSL